MTEIVRVAAGLFDNRASCTCGYRGERRWFRGLAVTDALIHAAQLRHAPAEDLVVPA